MFKYIKSIIKKIIFLFLVIVFKSKTGKYIAEKLSYMSMGSAKEIEYAGCKLKFAVPNRINHFRVDTFATKEPETLDWIGTFEKRSVFWDIGANIGLYSCYAAKNYDCKVYAFEPSIFNLELLGRNIFLNGLTDKVTIMPAPLAEKLFENKLNMSNTEWGGSQSTFGADYTYDGSKLDKLFDYKTIGISIDETVSLLKIVQPDYIKMDVDGIEHLILKGGKETLKKVKSILVEVDENFEIQKKKTSEYLTNAGFKLLGKKHSELFDNTKYKSCFNQIWKKK